MKKLLLLSLLFSIASSSYAKVGEGVSSLRNRLTVRSGGCIMYTSKDDQFREIKELPYKDLCLIMPKDTGHMFFFKRADGTQAVTSDTVDQNDLDGWELHVTSLKGQSVMECYRRHPFMNSEELARLMQALLKGKENITWIATSDFVKGNKAEEEEEEEETYDNPADQLMAHLSSILPKVKNKRVEIEIPREVQTEAGFNESLVKMMYIEARDKAFARKNAEVAADRERVSQATSRKGNTKSKTNSSSQKDSNSSVVGASSLGSINIKTERDATGKDIKFYTSIPNQDDTAFGFNYISTDGALRAKIILGAGNVPLGLLVFDTRYDKLMRKFMNELYDAQSKTRDEAAIKSVGSF